MGALKSILAFLSRLRCRCRSGCCVNGWCTCDTEIDGDGVTVMKKRWEGVKGLDGDL